MLPSVFNRRKYASPSLMDELFNNNFLSDFFNWESVWDRPDIPAVNIEETDKEYKIELAAPGLSKEDLKVSVDDGVLTVSSEMKKEEKDEKEGKYVRREFSYRSFSRSFSLPENTNAENIAASFKNGVLHISLPKTKEIEAPAKEIKIS